MKPGEHKVIRFRGKVVGHSHLLMNDEDRGAASSVPVPVSNAWRRMLLFISQVLGAVALRFGRSSVLVVLAFVLIFGFVRTLFAARCSFYFTPVIIRYHLHYLRSLCGTLCLLRLSLAHSLTGVF